LAPALLSQGPLIASNSPEFLGGKAFG